MTRRRRIKRHERTSGMTVDSDGIVYWRDVDGNTVRLTAEPPNSQLQTEDAWRAVWAAELSSRK